MTLFSRSLLFGAALVISGLWLSPASTAQSRTMDSEIDRAVDQTADFARHFSSFQIEASNVFDNPIFNALVAEMMKEDDFDIAEIERLYEEWKIDNAKRLKDLEAFETNIPPLPSKALIGDSTYNSLIVQRNAIPEYIQDSKELSARFHDFFTEFFSEDIDLDRLDEFSAILTERSIQSLKSENVILEQARAGLKEAKNPNYYLTGQSILSNNLAILDIRLFNDPAAATLSGRRGYVRKMEIELADMKDHDELGREFIEIMREQVQDMNRKYPTNPEIQKQVRALDGLLDHLHKEFDTEMKIMAVFQEKVDLYKSTQPYSEIEVRSLELDEAYYDLIDERLELFSQRAAFLDGL